jgi:hypothetical protein
MKMTDQEVREWKTKITNHFLKVMLNSFEDFTFAKGLVVLLGLITFDIKVDGFTIDYTNVPFIDSFVLLVNFM